MLESLRPFVGFVLRSPLVILGGFWLALWIAVRSEPRARRLLAHVHRLRAVFFGLVGTVLGLNVVLSFVARPGFDHVSTQIVAVSSLFRDGLPLYHALDSPTRYALLYGPAPYLVNAGLLALLPDTLFSIKALCVLLYVATLTGFYRFVRREAGPARAGAAVLLLAGLSLSVGNFVLMPRGEGLLLAASTLSLALAAWAKPGPRGWIAGGAMGLVTALSVDTKMHACLYVLPSWLWLWSTGGALAVTIALLSTAAGAASPFLHPQISVVHYVELLRAASRHGLSPALASMNVNLALVLASPFVFLRRPAARDKLAPGGSVWTASLCLVTGVVSVVASKHGAGVHHLLPLLPLLILGWVRYAGATNGASVRAPRLAAAWLATLLVVLAVNQFLLGLRDLEPSLGRPVARDAAAIVERLADGPVQVGLGASGASLGSAGVAAELSVAGQPHWFDAAALFDLSRAGIDPPPASAALVRSCATRHWLIPRGEAPFAVRSIYEPYPAVFDDGFREAFAASYELTESTTHFDVWSCRTE